MPIHNRKYLKSYRKELRTNLTPSEARLWKALQKKQLDGRKFRRQHSIGNYIVDFYCPSEKLVIEVDGSHHYTVSGEIADEDRDNFLRGLGLKILRFPNEVIHHKFHIVVEIIRGEFGREK